MLPPRMLKTSLQLRACTLAGFIGLVALQFPANAADAYKWSVQYLVDNSRAVFGRPQKSEPRNNRGLAISPDGKYLYAGYNKGFGKGGEVRRIAIDVADFDDATVAILPGPQGKGIATDDKGRVYITDERAILVFDATLQQRLAEIPCGVCDGVTVVREGAELALYATDREERAILRWAIQENGDGVSSAQPAGFGTNGKFSVPGAADLRGIRADAKGNLWFCDLAGGKVFRMDRDGKNLASVAVRTPLDLAFDNGRVFVTRYTDRAISVLDEEMNILGNLAVPWEELEISPFGNNQRGALAGIAVLPGKGFFVANEAGQTGNQTSTYGREDYRSGRTKGGVFRDAKGDDNDPILRATVVTVAE